MASEWAIWQEGRSKARGSRGGGASSVVRRGWLVGLRAAGALRVGGGSRKRFFSSLFLRRL